MNWNTVTFDGGTPKYAWPRTAFSVLLSFCSPWAKKKDLLPWLMLHKVTDGKYTWFKEALKKIFDSLLTSYNHNDNHFKSLPLYIYYHFIFSYLLLLMFYSRTCSHSCFRMLNTQKCLVRRNKWNYSSLFEMLMEINHIPFILTSSFT